MWEFIEEWSEGHAGLLVWLGVASLFVFVASIASLPLLLARIPADYFEDACAPRSEFGTRHPLAHWVLRVLRNIAGVVLVVLGLAMLALPGQGILTLLAGLVLVEFPGKRRLEMSLVRRPRVLAGLNWLRSRAGAGPLRVSPGG